MAIEIMLSVARPNCGCFLGDRKFASREQSMALSQRNLQGLGKTQAISQLG
jgi:hypothetical protein